MGRMRFRLFHLILEMCWYSRPLSYLRSYREFTRASLCGDSRSQRVVFLVASSFRVDQGFSRSQLGVLLVASSILVGQGFSRSQLGVLLVASSFRVGPQGYSSVSDNNNFVPEQSPENGYGYRAYGELSHFVYCILQKIKKSESLPLVEKWEDYMLPNHSLFAAVDEEHFVVGTRIHEALEKMSSQIKTGSRS